MIKLKPCPFCGNENTYILQVESPKQYQVVCNSNWDGCGASTGYYDTAKEAVEAWNSRAKMEVQDGQ